MPRLTLQQWPRNLTRRHLTQRRNKKIQKNLNLAPVHAFTYSDQAHTAISQKIKVKEKKKTPRHRRQNPQNTKSCSRYAAQLQRPCSKGLHAAIARQNGPRSAKCEGPAVRGGAQGGRRRGCLTCIARGGKRVVGEGSTIDEYDGLWHNWQRTLITPKTFTLPCK